MTEEFVPAEGRSVVYQIAPGEYRPAQIVKAWGATASSAVNLVVFLDGHNDARYGYDGSLTAWKTSRLQGDAVDQYLPRKPQEA